MKVETMTAGSYGASRTCSSSYANLSKHDYSSFSGHATRPGASAALCARGCMTITSRSMDGKGRLTSSTGSTASRIS
eukprot:1518505-Pyramimonas_sp.AAC.1